MLCFVPDERAFALAIPMFVVTLNFWLAFSLHEPCLIPRRFRSYEFAVIWYGPLFDNVCNYFEILVGPIAVWEVH